MASSAICTARYSTPPPRTHWGIVVSNAENFGTRPAISKIPAAIPNTTLLITFVVVTIPTFWL